MTGAHAVAYAAGLLAAWLIGRRAVRDFREMRRNNREAAEIFRSLLTTTHVCRNWHEPDRPWIEVEETITVDGLRLHRRSTPDRVEAHHFTTANGSDGHPAAPHVRCGRCHGADFRIRFGDYSVLAECAACGLADEVYSG